MIVVIPTTRKLTRPERVIADAALRLGTLARRYRELPALLTELNGDGALHRENEEHPSDGHAPLPRRLLWILDEMIDAADALERFVAGRANGVNGVNGH
jgi:hypothetical protein